MNKTQTLNQGREALSKQAWSSAYSLLSAADQKEPLEPDDLEGLATAAVFVGEEKLSSEILARAHQGFLTRGETRRAVRCAYWIGMMQLFNGEIAQANGWFSRANRLLENEPDCVEKGYLLMPAGLGHVYKGDPASAYKLFVQAAAIGERFGDRDLVTLALHAQGRALIKKGEIPDGVALLDEAMVAVTSNEVTPIVAGTVYCSVIEACSEIFDLHRAQEWTSALERWCSSQPEDLAYRGHCLTRRAEILQLRGAWSDALEQARLACVRLTQPEPKAAAGMAYYRTAELLRLRGELAEAEQAYRQASVWDPRPQPGLAQLRLIQGRLEAAHAAIRRASEETREAGRRATVLDALVEIALAAQDVEAAHKAADELAGLAERLKAPYVHALSERAIGAVLLAENDAHGALAILRQSWSDWRELEAPYEAARVQVLIALAYRALSDNAAADLELNAAHDVFKHLGAAPDLARVNTLLNKTATTAAVPLTKREIQVLKLVASGMTNKELASKLGISEKTVARHMSNIFVKLDLSSRAAATAYAYQHHLL
jgi:DNA-binding NarL/FixJ family response regulator